MAPLPGASMRLPPSRRASAIEFIPFARDVGMHGGLFGLAGDAAEIRKLRELLRRVQLLAKPDVAAARRQCLRKIVQCQSVVRNALRFRRQGLRQVIIGARTRIAPLAAETRQLLNTGSDTASQTWNCLNGPAATAACAARWAWNQFVPAFWAPTLRMKVFDVITRSKTFPQIIQAIREDGTSGKQQRVRHDGFVPRIKRGLGT